jgi:hypothetical protein
VAAFRGHVEEKVSKNNGFRPSLAAKSKTGKLRQDVSRRVSTFVVADLQSES